MGTRNAMSFLIEFVELSWVQNHEISKEYNGNIPRSLSFSCSPSFNRSHFGSFGC